MSTPPYGLPISMSLWAMIKSNTQAQASGVSNPGPVTPASVLTSEPVVGTSGGRAVEGTSRTLSEASSSNVKLSSSAFVKFRSSSFAEPGPSGHFQEQPYNPAHNLYPGYPTAVGDFNQGPLQPRGRGTGLQRGIFELRGQGRGFIPFMATGCNCFMYMQRGYCVCGYGGTSGITSASLARGVGGVGSRGRGRGRVHRGQVYKTRVRGRSSRRRSSPMTQAQLQALTDTAVAGTVIKYIGSLPVNPSPPQSGNEQKKD